jgi:hypothetical protein
VDVTEHSLDGGGVIGRPATERRHGVDRRSHLERAAALGSLVNGLRALCDAQARELTTIAKQTELLRVPTAPGVQYVAAIQRMSESVELLLTVGDRLRLEMETLDERVRDEAAILALAQGESGSVV